MDQALSSGACCLIERIQEMLNSVKIKLGTLELTFRLVLNSKLILMKPGDLELTS